MEDHLNRGLNFAILPFKLDLTQVLVDFKYFERTIIWKEFWAAKDQEDGVHPKIIKVRKETFLEIIRSQTN